MSARNIAVLMLQKLRDPYLSALGEPTIKALYKSTDLLTLPIIIISGIQGGFPRTDKVQQSL